MMHGTMNVKFNFVMSAVRQHVITRLPPDRFSLKLILDIFMKKFQKFQILLKLDKNTGHFI